MPRHNPEKSAWKGKSYKKGGELVRELKGKNLPEAKKRDWLDNLTDKILGKVS